ncbi:MAG: hypothetical protein K2Y37_24000 [Pirellulales bacterium]|nr:hypothetical protein [Pirellulales bacterium]
MILICAIVGCGHSGLPDPAHPSRGWASRVDADDPATQRALAQALEGPREFSLCLSEGSGLYGYDSVVIEGGTCRLLLAEPMHRGKYWYRANKQYEFPITPAENEVLLDHLRAVGILPRGYDGGYVDGTQVFVAMIVDGHRKQVYCNNYFPKQVVNLRNYLFNELVPSHQADMKITDAEPNGTMNHLW